LILAGNRRAIPAVPQALRVAGEPTLVRRPTPPDPPPGVPLPAVPFSCRCDTTVTLPCIPHYLSMRLMLHRLPYDSTCLLHHPLFSPCHSAWDPSISTLDPTARRPTTRSTASQCNGNHTLSPRLLRAGQPADAAGAPPRRLVYAPRPRSAALAAAR